MYCTEEIEIIAAPAPPIALKQLGNLIVNAPQLYRMTESLSPIAVISPGPDTILSHPGYMGTILLTTMNRDGGMPNAHRFTPLGYQVNRNFYSPDYETANQQNDPTPDRRTTIYWNPFVQTNETGQATIRFMPQTFLKPTPSP